MSARPPLIPATMLEEIRARLPIAGVVGRAVRLEKAGAWMKGLCPFHAEKSPSFAVKPQEHSFHCFGCGAHGDVVGFVMRLEGLGFPEAVRRCAAEAGLSGEIDAAAARAPWVDPRLDRHPAPLPAAPDTGDRDPTPAELTAMARRIWDRGTGIGPESPVAGYLAGRGLWPLPFSAHAVLRLGECRHPKTGDRLHPTLLARIDGPDAEFRAVHRTFLARQADGCWTKLSGFGDPRLSLGPIRGCAIRLFPAAAHLGVAEGIETALAASRLSDLPVWSCLNSGNLAAAELPPDVEACTIFADRDRPRLRGEGGYRGPNMPEGAGIHCARKLDTRLRALAIQTTLRAPDRGDYADVWLARQQGASA